MSAAGLLTRLQAAGVHLELVPNRPDAVVARPRALLSDELRAEIVAHKAELVAALRARSGTRRTCATCRHRSRVGTCKDPVAAGLAEEFLIVWPDARHAKTCAAWRRNPAEAIVAIYIAAAKRGWRRPEVDAWLRDADADPDAVLDVLKATTG